ncbi:MAG: phosphate ABC transporter permease subunit PstC [Nitrososphaerales archaeon]
MIKITTFYILAFFTLLTILILPFYIGGILYGSREFYERISFLDFLLGKEWSLPEQKYGALPAIYGTLIVAALALLIAMPISIGGAIALIEFLPKRLSDKLGIIVDLIAVIPSVVVGLWGLLALGPFLKNNLYSFLSENLSFIPLFQSSFFTSYNKLTASLVLAYMISPFALAVIKENLKLVPWSIKEAAYSLGLNHWEVVRVMLSYIKPGILAAFMIALGRAVAEAVAVSMVIGNTCSFSFSLLDPACTLSTLIINNFAEATGIEASALIGLGFVLFILALTLVILTRFIYIKALGGYLR